MSPSSNTGRAAIFAAALAALTLCSAAGAVVNLNTATRDELVALPGIGPAKAQAIVDHRTQHGPFKTVDEVRKVKGIGEKLFLQIKPELTVGQAPRAPAGGAPKPEARADAKADSKAGPRGSTGPINRDERARP
jgi:competence protein ComEA